MSIRQVFEAEGEVGFRRRESAVLEELCGLRGHVVATGGGVVLSAANRGRLKAAGRVVWLTADARTIRHRLEKDRTTGERRPVLTVGGLAEIKELLRARSRSTGLSPTSAWTPLAGRRRKSPAPSLRG